MLVAAASTERSRVAAVESAVRPVADMAPLVRRVAAFLAERAGRSASWQAPYDAETLAARFGFTPRRQGTPEVVLGDEVAIELGHPSTASLGTVLASWEPGSVQPARISIVGPDVDAVELGARRSFAQVVMLLMRAGRVPDTFQVDAAQLLLHRLPGWVVRSLPGRLWARISRSGLARGLDLKAVGSALIAAYTREFEEVEAAEVVFVTSGPSDVEALRQIAVEAGILTGRLRRLALGVDGSIECNELSCTACEDKPVCDVIRDVVVRRKGMRDAHVG